MPARIYDPFCRHDDCAGQPRPIPVIDYHDLRGGKYFSGYTPQAWCCLECIIADILHAIQDEDLEQLRMIRFLIESGEAIPPSRRTEALDESDGGNTRKDDNKALLTEGEFTVDPTRKAANAV